MSTGNPADGSESASQTASPVDRHILSAHHRIARRPDGATARRPLTHHEIFGLIEPFTRHGRHIDLPASDRMERRLVFKPIVHGDETPSCAGAREVLQLENLRPEVFRLTRSLTLASGATATLVTDGPDPAELLARIETIPLERHFQWVAKIPIARSYRLEPGKGDATQPMRMVLTSAEAWVAGLTLVLKAETGRGYPAEIELSPQPDAPRDVLDFLPDDLLATLGWHWKVLRRRRTSWNTTLRVPRSEPRRSRRIEIALERTVAHIAQTLAEPPRRFHDRLLRARWAVFFRRSFPLLLSVGMIAGAVALTFADIPQDSMMLMLIFNLPPLLLLLVFSMRELPRFEIPPLPRRSVAPSWFPLGQNAGQPADQKQGA